MNRRTFLQLLGLAPAAAVVAKEVVAQPMPAPHVETAAERIARREAKLRALGFEDPRKPPCADLPVYLTDTVAVSLSRDKAHPGYPNPIGTIVSVEPDGRAWVRVGGKP